VEPLDTGTLEPFPLMKALIQRVTGAEVTVEGKTVGAIDRGILVLLGVEKGDTDRDLEYIVRKITNLRIFHDNEGKMNLSLKDIAGEVLVVSQFTLSADCRKGNRPSFDHAEGPEKANTMYRKAVERLNNEGISVSTGKFASSMQVSLINDGPVTFLLDSR